jgi:hypothetical protein
MMHPIEEAVEFLLNHVKRHGDPPVQEKAEGLLQRIARAREELWEGATRQVAERLEAADHLADDGKGFDKAVSERLASLLPEDPTTNGAGLEPPPGKMLETNEANVGQATAGPPPSE